VPGSKLGWESGYPDWRFRGILQFLQAGIATRLVHYSFLQNQFNLLFTPHITVRCYLMCQVRAKS
jgi:hypothetical protein